MSRFVWKDEYRVNIREFDIQHKKLVDLLNQLFDAMAEGKSKDIMGYILNELIQYTAVHFSDEEKVMSAHDFPGLESHMREHELLKKQVLEFKSDFDSGKAPLSIEMMMFLKDWLSNHINDTDKEYGPFLNERGVS